MCADFAAHRRICRAEGGFYLYTNAGYFSKQREYAMRKKLELC